jgi:dihydropteroate synthase
LGLGPDERQTATAVAVGLLVARGVLVHRVHDAALACQAAAIAAAMTTAMG